MKLITKTLVLLMLISQINTPVFGDEQKSKGCWKKGEIPALCEKIGDDLKAQINTSKEKFLELCKLLISYLSSCPEVNEECLDPWDKDYGCYDTPPNPDEEREPRQRPIQELPDK